MTYWDTVPVGTPVRDNRGTVWVKRYSNGWRRDGATGSMATHLLVLAHGPLVELVAKPAPLVDGQGYRWEPPVEPVYRIRLDQGFSDWLTRAEIEAEDGPLTEATE